MEYQYLMNYQPLDGALYSDNNIFSALNVHGQPIADYEGMTKSKLLEYYFPAVGTAHPCCKIWHVFNWKPRHQEILQITAQRRKKFNCYIKVCKTISGKPFYLRVSKRAAELHKYCEFTSERLEYFYSDHCAERDLIQYSDIFCYPKSAIEPVSDLPEPQLDNDILGLVKAGKRFNEAVYKMNRFTAFNKKDSWNEYAS